jgi:hypothetical protein
MPKVSVVIPVLHGRGIALDRASRPFGLHAKDR